MLHSTFFHRKNPSHKHLGQWAFRVLAGACALCLTAPLLLIPGGIPDLTVQAASSAAIQKQLEDQRAMTIESNQIPNWPVGPVVGAQSAILIEAETGTVLYSKNIHAKQYPASTTKILTALIAAEESSMDEVVTFSHDAVYGIPAGSNHIAMNEGDTLTMEQCLNAILIRSANEVSYAVAEHIGGTWEGFAEKMNARAKELGCVDSHFVNPNGLPDEDHYTSAYDLAMIGRAFFANEMLCKMTTTPMLRIPKASGEYLDVNKMELLPGKKYSYEYLVGCKTGYTDDARSCLVSCAEKDGLKLICVVLRDESPYHYEDTIALFDYGFSNFEKVNISQAETKYNIDTTGSFYSDNDIFGNSKPILSLNQEAFIVLPKTADFSDTVSTISYDTQNENQAALITYTYHDIPIGAASVDLAVDTKEGYSFDITVQNPDAPVQEPREEKTSFLFINVIKVLLYVAGAIVLVGIVFAVCYILKNYHFAARNNRRSWLRERRKRRTPLSSSDSLATRRKQQIKAAKRRQRRSRRHSKSRGTNRFRDYD